MFPARGPQSGCGGSGGRPRSCPRGCSANHCGDSRAPARARGPDPRRRRCHSNPGPSSPAHAREDRPPSQAARETPPGPARAPSRLAGLPGCRPRQNGASFPSFGVYLLVLSPMQMLFTHPTNIDWPPTMCQADKVPTLLKFTLNRGDRLDSISNICRICFITR